MTNQIRVERCAATNEICCYCQPSACSHRYVDIERLPPIKKHSGGWIPCSERLPNHPNQVLITIKWDSPFDNDYEVTLGEYWGEEYGWGFENGEVLAWMSLPEPYKG